MDTAKILKTVIRVRSELASFDRDLAAIEAEILKGQVPAEPKKRRNLRAVRVEDIERAYARGGWRKRAS